jgi:hypothetical protein
MPGAAAVTTAVNTALNTSPGGVRHALAGKSTVRAVLDDLGVLDRLDPGYAAEARAVLDQLSGAQNREILDGVTNALSAGQAVRVAWVEAAAIEVDVTSDVAGVAVTLRTPDGRQFLSGP